MIFVTFLRDTGEIVPPVIASDNEQNFDNVFGSNAEIYKKIYDSTNIKTIMETASEGEIINTILKDYKIDIATKELIKKDEKTFNIEDVIKNES